MHSPGVAATSVPSERGDRPGRDGLAQGGGRGTVPGVYERRSDVEYFVAIPRLIIIIIIMSFYIAPVSA